jgi:Signal transduction histidine kinase regulating C4-dicarboxylate transport system
MVTARPTPSATHHVLALTIVAVTMLTIASIAWFGWTALGKFTAVHTLWSDYSHRELTITENFSRMRSSLGYGGFIHNFKNYVLRQDQRYAARIEHDRESFRAAIDRLDPFFTAEDERAALAEVRRTFEEYFSKFEIAKTLVATGRTAEQIDHVVKVDDANAIAALAVLSSKVRYRAGAQEEKARAAMEAAISFLLGGSVILLMVAAAAGAMLFFLKRITATNAALNRTRCEAEEALATLQRAQAILVEAEKMASLGQLVAGIAHEINTPVGVTLSAATHLAAQAEQTDKRYAEGELSGDELEAFLAMAQEACRLMTMNSQRAAELIQSFKQVAVDQTADARRIFDLGTYLNEILLSLRPALKAQPVTVEVDCPAGITVDGYPGALSQVVSNLINNSLLHGFGPGGGGRITLTARLRGDGSVQLVHADDGRGIPAHLLPKVFDPFFTTRRDAGGSGLGLHIVYNIVHQRLGGTIAVDSPSGGGARFLIQMPLHHPDARSVA